MKALLLLLPPLLVAGSAVADAAASAKPTKPIGKQATKPPAKAATKAAGPAHKAGAKPVAAPAPAARSAAPPGGKELMRRAAAFEASQWKGIKKLTLRVSGYASLHDNKGKRERGGDATFELVFDGKGKRVARRFVSATRDGKKVKRKEWLASEKRRKKRRKPNPYVDRLRPGWVCRPDGKWRPGTPSPVSLRGRGAWKIVVKRVDRKDRVSAVTYWFDRKDARLLQAKYYLKAKGPLKKGYFLVSHGPAGGRWLRTKVSSVIKITAFFFFKKELRSGSVYTRHTVK